MTRLSLDQYLKPFLSCCAILTIHRAQKWEKHALHVYHIHYVFKGEEAWTLQDGSILRMKGGHIGILQPHVFHGCEMDVMYPAKTLSLSPAIQAPKTMPVFSHKQAINLLNIFKSAGNCVIPAPPELESMFIKLQDLTDVTTNRNYINNMRISLLLAQITVSIANAFSAPPHDQHSRIIEKVKALIEQNVTANVKMSAIASQAGMKKAYFHILFRKITGRTPADYRAWLRCEHGRKLLTESSMPIIDIANKLNFSSSQHFSSRFKKQFGITPLKYRKENRTANT